MDFGMNMEILSSLLGSSGTAAQQQGAAAKLDGNSFQSLLLQLVNNNSQSDGNALTALNNLDILNSNSTGDSGSSLIDLFLSGGVNDRKYSNFSELLSDYSGIKELESLQSIEDSSGAFTNGSLYSELTELLTKGSTEIQIERSVGDVLTNGFYGSEYATAEAMAKLLQNQSGSLQSVLAGIEAELDGAETDEQLRAVDNTLKSIEGAQSTSALIDALRARIEAQKTERMTIFTQPRAPATGTTQQVEAVLPTGVNQQATNAEIPDAPGTMEKPTEIASAEIAEKTIDPTKQQQQTDLFKEAIFETVAKQGENQYAENTVQTNQNVTGTEAAAKVNAPMQSGLTPEAYEQISRQITARLEENGAMQFKMQLEPQNLGQIDVDILMKAGKLSIEIMADNPQTHSLLLSQVDKLIASLGLQNAQVETITVNNQSVKPIEGQISAMNNSSLDYQDNGGNGQEKYDERGQHFNQNPDFAEVSELSEIQEIYRILKDSSRRMDYVV